MAEDGVKNELLVKAGQRDWSDVPADLLTLILSCLDIKGAKLFLSICKTWRSVFDPKYLSPLGFPVPQSQWLIHKKTDQTKCKFFHPTYGFIYCIYILELRGAVIQHSKGGWLLMSQEENQVFFFNPFSNAKIELPDLTYPFNAMTFTSIPTSSDCMVVAVVSNFDSDVCFSTIRRGEKDWNLQEFKNNLPITPSHCNPIFHQEKFFWLGRKGNLGIFDPNNDQWTVLDDPQELDDYKYESYLVDCDGELISVFLSSMGSQISVFKLDESKMKWQEVKDLSDHMLFLSVRTSFSRKTVMDQMKNKIYFPRFHQEFPSKEKYCVFYSLDTCKYETFGNGFSREDLYDTSELMECSWIEPRDDHYTEEQLYWFDESDTSSEDDDSTDCSDISSESEDSDSLDSSDTPTESDSDSANLSDTSSESDNCEDE